MRSLVGFFDNFPAIGFEIAVGAGLFREEEAADPADRLALAGQFGATGLGTQAGDLKGVGRDACFEEAFLALWNHDHVAVAKNASRLSLHSIVVLPLMSRTPTTLPVLHQ
jgi:hypothetical protein